MPKALGRPRNVYQMPTAEFAAYWAREKKFDTIDEVLELDPGFGAVGYVVNKLSTHRFRVTFVPTDVTSMFFWVRLETPEGEGRLDFAIPAVIARADIPTLLNWWGMVDEPVKWVLGPISSYSFPASWKMMPKYVTTPKRFHVLILDTSAGANSVTLHTQGGIHTIRSRNSFAKLAGVLSEENLWKVVEAFRLTTCVLPKNELSLLNSAVVTQCWAMSAAYFRERLLEVPEGKANPFIPHGALLDIPLHTMPTEFEP